MKLSLEKQLTNFELSKELKELGEPQESQWYWVQLKDEVGYYLALKLVSRENWFVYGFKFGFSIAWRENYVQEVCSAFTVAELGANLPYSIKSARGEDYIRSYDEFDYIYMDRDRDSFYYFGKKIVNSEPNITEANGRAKMRIYLIKKEVR